jgi:tetratricopeptide (TPR) repeat protein
VDTITVSTELATTDGAVSLAQGPLALLAWRDPHTVPPEALVASIETLKRACAAEPRSADLRTCLGVAYAMNHRVDEAMESLEAAVSLAPNSFWPQLKYAELHYRLRVLNKAETETISALNLATNAWQLTIARKQLQDIRTLKHACVRNVEWSKPLTAPALVLTAMLLAIFAVMLWT